VTPLSDQREFGLASARVIRVFVSSTFRDMQPEREELIKRTFPQLRKLCEMRAVTFSEVDLRWGVTDEQKAEGLVLPICLEEIRRCRPYFIGLLGDRYGWIPDHIEPPTLAQEPWLSGYTGRSVTELEMVSGVLDNPEMAGHAFFYFRDRAASAALQSSLPADAAPSGAAAKLDALKERIRRSGLPLSENFQSPEELGALVLADFTRLIDRLFPLERLPDPLDQQAVLHDSFAAQRAQVYVGRDEYFDRLDAHARADGAPLAVLGESGSGKSALLANWAGHYRAVHPDDFVFIHFIGAASASSDWALLARRLIGELNRRFALSLPTPDDPAALRKALTDSLRMAGVMHRLVIVLDGLDQLEDRDQAPDLAWLPSDPLPRVRLIASTLPGRALAEIRRRAWTTLTVTPLDAEERKDLIVAYLGRYTKALDDSQISLVAEAPMSGNPLFLTALLEELRVWGVYETLNDQIRHYIAAPSVGELFQRILARYERDYDRDRPGLVRDSFCAIWAARQGLSEPELLDLLGQNGEPLPHAYWSPLHLAAERSLVSHSGLLTFFHDYLRQAVRDRYLGGERQQHDAHIRLADYFAARELSPRKIAELPWQFTQAQEWKRVAGVLGELPLIKAAMKDKAYEIYAYWSRVTEHIPDAPLKAYQKILEDPNNNLEYLYPVSLILLRLRFTKQSSRLQSYLFQLMEQLDTFHVEAFVGLAIDSAANERAAGDLEAAMSIIAMATDAARRRGSARTQAAAIGNQATCFQLAGKHKDALALFDESETLAREANDKALLCELLNNRASIVARVDPASALRLLSEVERLSREIGSYDALCACLGNQGQALLRLGDLDTALAKLQEQEKVSREIGQTEGLRNSLLFQAFVYSSRHNPNEAIRALDARAALCRRIDDRNNLAETLLLQANIRAEFNLDLDTALKEVIEQQQLCRSMGNDASLAAGLMVHANLLSLRHEDSQSMDALREAEAIFRRLADKSGLAICLVAEARRLEAGGRGGEVTRFLKEAERLYRETGNVEGEARAMFDQARLFFAVTGMAAAALPDMRKAQTLAQTHGLAGLAENIKQFADGIDRH
jgi:hypothetical protein